MQHEFLGRAWPKGRFPVRRIWSRAPYDRATVVAQPVSSSSEKRANFTTTKMALTRRQILLLLILRRRMRKENELHAKRRFWVRRLYQERKEKGAVQLFIGPEVAFAWSRSSNPLVPARSCDVEASFSAPSLLQVCPLEGSIIIWFSWIWRK